MQTIKALISSTLVVIYACIMMYLLLDVHFSKLSFKRKISSMVFFVVFLIFNIWVQLALGYQLYGKFYILFTQLPVYILFLMISEYRGIKLFFVLLTAVFFSSPITVLFLLIRCVMPPPLWLYLCIVLLLLFIIKRFFKEPFNYMLQCAGNWVFGLFISIPLLFYIYIYSLTQYQVADRVVNKEFFIQQIPMLIVLISYLLLVQIFKMISEKAELNNAQNLIFAQLNAATEQIEQLKRAEKQSAIYRHDLRHHMNYLNLCISENKIHEALEYIAQTSADMERTKIIRYSTNEPINLIVSFYAAKAVEKQILIKIHIFATDFTRFQITDLCTLLANAMENAINANVQEENASERFIQLRMYEKSNKLCLEICNHYCVEPVFDKEIPMAEKIGHGIGVKSMIHIVEKYQGVYKFSAQQGVFVFQASI